VEGSPTYFTVGQCYRLAALEPDWPSKTNGITLSGEPYGIAKNMSTKLAFDPNLTCFRNFHDATLRYTEIVHLRGGSNEEARGDLLKKEIYKTLHLIWTGACGVSSVS